MVLLASKFQSEMNEVCYYYYYHQLKHVSVLAQYIVEGRGGVVLLVLLVLLVLS